MKFKKIVQLSSVSSAPAVHIVSVVLCIHFSARRSRLQSCQASATCVYRVK